MIHDLKPPRAGKHRDAAAFVVAASQARGRNGWFQPAHFQVNKVPDGTIGVSLYSRVIGENPPVYVELAPNQWEQIIKAVRAAQRPPRGTK